MRTFAAWILLVLGVGCAPAMTEKASAQERDSNAERLHNATATTDGASSSAVRGLRVYREQLCGLCHSFERAATNGIFGPPHDDFARIAAQRIEDEGYSGNARTPAEYVRESIVDPAAYVVPGYESGFHHMPPYLDLAPDDLQALVELLLLDEKSSPTSQR